MRTFQRCALTILATAATALAPHRLEAQGKIVTYYDEWFTYPDYFNPNAQQFVSNVVDWFGLGSGSNVLVSSGTSLTLNSTFYNFLNSKGLNVTADSIPPVVGYTGQQFIPYAGYDAVIVSNAGFSYDGQQAYDYVLGGGKMFYIGGTNGNDGDMYSWGLSSFGLSFGPGNNTIDGVVGTGVSSLTGPFGPALFHDVNVLYYALGPTPVILTDPYEGIASRVQTQLFMDGNGTQFAGAMEISDLQTAPEPGTVVLVASGLVALVTVRRRLRVA